MSTITTKDGTQILRHTLIKPHDRHSGLSGIFQQKDSRRASLAGMTNNVAFIVKFLVIRFLKISASRGE